MKRSWFVAVSIVSAVFGGIVAMSACSNQQEGEVCSTANGNDDCDTDDNLACYPANQLNNVTSDRCCPVDRSTATHPACVIPVAVVGGDAQAPLDSGPPVAAADASTPDATTTTDAGRIGDASDQ